MQFRIGGLVGLVDIADLMTSPTSWSEMSSSVSQNFCSKYRSSVTPPRSRFFSWRSVAWRDKKRLLGRLTEERYLEQKCCQWCSQVQCGGHWLICTTPQFVSNRTADLSILDRMNFKMSFFGRFLETPIFEQYLINNHQLLVFFFLVFLQKTVWRA